MRNALRNRRRVSNAKSLVTETLEDRRLLTGAGDANLDFYFDESDFVQIFQAGKFNDPEPATWAEGDFNGDEIFDTGDFVVAFTEGLYKTGPYDEAATEPQHTRYPLPLNSNADVTLNYDPDTGSLLIESTTAITTLHLHSESGLFEDRQRPSLFTGLFDTFDAHNAFKLNPAGWTTLSFTSVLPPNLTLLQLTSDLTIDGSYIQGGQIDVGLACDGCMSAVPVSPVASGAGQIFNDTVALTNASPSFRFDMQQSAQDQLSLFASFSEDATVQLTLNSVPDNIPLLVETLTSDTVLMLPSQAFDQELLAISLELVSGEAANVQLDMISNAVFEQESLGQGSNSDLANPQSLADSFAAAPFDMQLSSVLGQLDAADALPRFISDDSFESGSLDASWTIRSDDGGRITVTDAFGAGDGSYSLVMDGVVPAAADDDQPVLIVFYDPVDGTIRSQNLGELPLTTLELISNSGIFTGNPVPEEVFDNVFDVDADTKLFELDPAGLNDWNLMGVAATGLTLEFLEQDLQIDGSLLGGGKPRFELHLDPGNQVTNEAILSVDTTGADAVQLEFQYAEWNDDESAIPAVYTGSVFGDGVSISVDGNRWYRIFTPTDQPAGEWHSEQINLTEAAAAHNLSLDGTLQVKFQQAGERPIPNGGRAYDGIRISTLVDVDWYAMTPNAGEYVSFVSAAHSSGSSSLRLFSESGELLASGDAHSQADAVINNFLADGSPLRIAVSGTAEDYTLLTIRNGQFEPDVNARGVKPNSPTGNTVGARIAGESQDTYGYVTSGNATDVRLADSLGQVRAAETESAGFDGVRNELQTVVVNHTNGQYFLQASPELPAEVRFVAVPEQGGVTANRQSVKLDSLFEFDANTITANDLSVDATEALRVSLVSPHVAEFTLTPLEDGTHTISLPAGAVADQFGVSNQAIQSDYQVDTVRPELVSSSITNGQLVPTGLVTLDLVFNESVVLDSEFRLRSDLGTLVTPNSVDYDDTTFTARLTYDLPAETSYALNVSNFSAIQDLAGLAIREPISIEFTTDISGAQITGPTLLVGQPGAAVHQTEAKIGFIGAVDVDDFVINVDANQILTAQVFPTDDLVPLIEIVSPDGERLATNADSNSPHVSAAVTSAGEYRIQISGKDNSTGSFRLETRLNGIYEDVVSNDSAETAQVLQPWVAYAGTTVRQTTVSGLVDNSDAEDWYSFSLEDGEAVALHLDSATNRSDIALFDATGKQLYQSSSSAQQETIQPFIDGTTNGLADEYKIRVRRATNASTPYLLTTIINASWQVDADLSPDQAETNVSFVYHADTGQLDLRVDEGLVAVVEIQSFQGLLQGNLNDFDHFPGLFDVYTSRKAFKLDPRGFGSLTNFANVGPGRSIDELTTDLRFDGAILGGGNIGDVEIVGTIPNTSHLPTPRLDLVNHVVGYLNESETHQMPVHLEAGGSLTLETQTLGDGDGLFQNELNPSLTLLSPAGDVVASDQNSAADGKNAKLTFTATETGNYLILISSESGAGEYLLSASGDLTSPGFQALTTNPAADSSINYSLDYIDVQFNQLVDANSLQPTDIQIAGQPADSVSLFSSNVVRFFASNIPNEGLVQVTMPAAAVSSVGGQASSGLEYSFEYDALAPRVLRTSLDDSNVVDAGNLTVEIQFSEAIEFPDSVSDALRLQGIGRIWQPISADYDSVTHALTVDFGVVEEGGYLLDLMSGIRDKAGNHLSGVTSWSLAVQGGIEPYEGGFAEDAPLEGFSLSGEVLEKTFAFGEDEDIIPFSLPANQLITIRTNDAQGRHQATLLDPAGNMLVTQSSDSVGSLLVARGNAAGTYQLILQSTSGAARRYASQILLNQISEAESVRNRSNNVGWTAEPLDRFFDNSLVPHVTVSGLGRQSWDVYAVTVQPGEHLSAGLTADSDQLFLEVLNSDEQVIASGQPGTNFDQAIREVQDRSNSGLSSVYYLRIRTLDRTEVPYSLSVFRNATIASNTTPTWFGPNLAAVGSLTSEAATSEFVFQAGSGANINASLQIPFSSANVAEPLAASLRLLGPNGQTVATGEGALSHTSTAPGEYRLQVVRTSGQGAFELQVSGSGVTAVPIKVTSFAPAGNPTLFGLPETITVEFNQPVDVNSVAVDDLSIGNEPAVFVRANSPTSFTFGLGPNADVGDGEYTVRLAANAVTNLAGLPQDVFETSFTVDRSSADFDNDGDVDLQDLDAYCVARRQHPALHDINQDGRFDFQDYLQILSDTFGVTPGDADLDGDFNSQDLVKIFEGGKYETGQTDASWQDGDFDCDGQVTSADFVLVFRADTYTANIALDAIAAADLDEQVSSAGQTSLQITPPAEVTVVPAQQRIARQRNSDFAPAENRSPRDDHTLTKNVERDHVFAEFQLSDVWL